MSDRERQLDCNGRPLSLTAPAVMGVLNVTPDSFSDGGRYNSLDRALAQAHRMVDEGAAILDVGGESTRPGAAPVTEQEELDRVIPLIERLRSEQPLPISIDTSKAVVMREAVRAGAGLINDVCALQLEGALETVAAAQVPVCLMHMQGQPRTMQKSPRYDNVVEDVRAFLIQRMEACTTAGINLESVLVDPGFGFGKTLQHNLSLLKHLSRFCDLGAGVLVGMSRKSMIGAVLNKEVDERLFGSIAVATLAASSGARVIRVHDVGPTVDALKVVAAVEKVD